MAKIIRFQHHRLRKPNTEGAAFSPRRAKRSVTDRKCSAGIRPRIFQLQIAEAPKAILEATAVGPPSLSMTSCTELSMSPYNSHGVKMSSPNKMEMASKRGEMFNAGMDSRETIAARLLALEGQLGKSGKEMADLLGCKESAWSQYKKPDSGRTITLQYADRLAELYGVPLDWLYRGRAVDLPQRFSVIALVGLAARRKRA